MKYMLLVYETEEEWGNLSEAERGPIVNEYMQLTQRLKSAGNYLGSAQLRMTVSATSVRIRNGHRLLTDAPFAETHEQLGGYYLIEAKISMKLSTSPLKFRRHALEPWKFDQSLSRPGGLTPDSSMRRVLAQVREESQTLNV